MVQVGGGVQILGWPSGRVGVGVPAHRVDPPVYAPQMITGWRAVMASGKRREDGQVANEAWRSAPAGTCASCRNGLQQREAQIRVSATNLGQLARNVEEHERARPAATYHRRPGNPRTAYLLYSWAMIPVFFGAYFAFLAVTPENVELAVVLAAVTAAAGFAGLVHRRSARKEGEAQAKREAQHRLGVAHAREGRTLRDALAQAQKDHKELREGPAVAAARNPELSAVWNDPRLPDRFLS